MIINHNMNALNAHRNMMNNINESGKSMEKLSSGLRINRAGDDAAGLAISEKMRAQIRGLDQASRNAQDGISLIQTAEGALNETHAILQRMRELSTQAANDTNTSSDRGEIQNEINQLTSEINRIGNTTEFNTIKLLDGTSEGKVSSKPKEAVLKGLKSWWLKGGADIVKDSYGLSADGKNLKVVIDDNSSNAEALAFVSYTKGKDGKSENLELHVNMKFFADIDLTEDKDGNSNGNLLDRTIAHEMAHAIMGRSMDFGSMATWFKEGTAEAVHGADERLRGDIYAAKGSSDDDKIKDIMNSLGSFKEDDWDQTSKEYSASYIAVRFMDYQMAKANSDNTKGIELVMKHLSNNPGSSLDDALKALGTAGSKNAPWDNEADFISDLKAKITTKASLETYAGIKLEASGAEKDTGSILGADAEAAGGTYDKTKEKTAKDVLLENTDTITAVPTGTETIGGFKVVWPSETESNSSKGAISFQVGANSEQAISIGLEDMRAEALGIAGASEETANGVGNKESGAKFAKSGKGNVTNGTDSNVENQALDISNHEKASNAIETINQAIEKVSSERSKLGAYQNRLDHTINNLNNASQNLTSAESRIRDVDMAKEMMAFSKKNILSQAAQSMLVQAKQQPQGVLQLLR